VTGPAHLGVEAALAAIRRDDARVGAFTQVFTDAARADAVRLDGTATAGLLHGLPVGIKELFDVAGADGSRGSDTLAGRVADRDAFVVGRLREAGAVPVGLTRSHELAWGVTTQHATRGSTRNPWDTGRVPGGSSGGSAAAVAAGMVRLAVGTDTGGSIRIPAAWCGVFGLKTTWRRIGRGGLVPLAPSLDTVGFLADSVPLLHAALAATVGDDPDDPATAGGPPLPGDWEPEVPDGLRVAVPRGLGPEVTDADRLAALARVTGALTGLGAVQVEVEVPGCADLTRMFGTIQLYEAYQVHTTELGTWPDRADRYGPDVRRRLELAAEVTQEQYLATRRESGRTMAAVLDALSPYRGGAEVLVSLVGTTGPSRVDDPDHVVTRTGERIPLRQAVMPTTVPQNLTGLPSVTVPAGLDDDGLPIGVQLTGAPFTEPLLLAVAAALEATGATPFRPAPGFAR
jgi:aspartyl-tRNA(Asn)/glutamyl-tRNA(Gln) amidotransferase subunit A